MKEKPGKITVYSNGEGKLYIKQSELFALEKVQEIIRRAAKLKLDKKTL